VDRKPGGFWAKEKGEKGHQGGWGVNYWGPRKAKKNARGGERMGGAKRGGGTEDQNLRVILGKKHAKTAR